jgi:hypothetical protein
MKSQSSEPRSLQSPTPNSPVEAVAGGPCLPPTVRGAIPSRNTSSSSAIWSGDGVQLSAHPRGPPPKGPDVAGHKHKVETEAAPSLSVPYTAHTNGGSDFDDQSLPNAFAQPLTVLLASNGPFELKLKEVIYLRDKVVEKRVNIGNAETELERQRQYTKEAQNRFMKASRAFMASVDDIPSGSNNKEALRRDWELLQQSSNLFKSRGKRLRSAQHELQEWENQLLLKEGDLYEDYLKKFLGAMSSASSSEETETQHTDDFEAVSAQSGSSETMEPVVQQYYDRIGDVNILRERMYNFEGDHRRLVLLRDAQRQEGLGIDPPEKEFYEVYFQKREFLVREYASTKDEMYRLRSECQNQGFHVEDPNLPSFLDQSYRIERSIVKYSAPVREGRFNPDVYLLFGHLDNNVRVARWISDVRRATQDVSVDPPVVKVKATKHAEIKPVAPKSPNETSSWTDVEVEDYIKLPYYGQLQPSEGDALEKDETEQVFEKIQGDPPQRRYSEPNLPAFPRRPGDKMWRWHHTGHFDVLCKSCILSKRPKSLQ